MSPVVFPNDRDDAASLARRLLDAAGPGLHDQVATVTGGPAGIGFDVPDSVYKTVFAAAPAGPAGADGGDDRETQTPDSSAEPPPKASAEPAPDSVADQTTTAADDANQAGPAKRTTSRRQTTS